MFPVSTLHYVFEQVITCSDIIWYGDILSYFGNGDVLIVMLQIVYVDTSLRYY